MPKKSAETMFTRLDTTRGRLAVSAMKPAAITKASVAAGEKPSAISMAIIAMNSRSPRRASADGGAKEGIRPQWPDAAALAIARRIADAGTTVLMVEQNVKKALAVADRGYVMERGTLVASGPAKLLARSTVIREAYLGADKDPATGTTSAADAVQRRKAVATP
mgnify:CR=1 FL=1